MSAVATQGARRAAGPEGVQGDIARRKPSDFRAMTDAIANDDIAPDESWRRRRNGEVMAAGVAAWERARRAAGGESADVDRVRAAAERAKRWRAAAHAVTRAFSDAHPLGLTRREHGLLAAILAAEDAQRTGPALCARAGIPPASFHTVAMMVRRKLARHGGALIFDRASSRWRAELPEALRRRVEATP